MDTLIRTRIYSPLQEAADKRVTFPSLTPDPITPLPPLIPEWELEQSWDGQHELPSFTA